MDTATIVAFIAIAGSILTTLMTTVFSLREKRASSFETVTEGMERVIVSLNGEITRLNTELDECRRSLADCRSQNLWPDVLD